MLSVYWNISITLFFKNDTKTFLRKCNNNTALILYTWYNNSLLMNIIGMLEVFETSTGESEWIQKQVHTPTEEYCTESSHSIVCMAFTVLNIQSDRDQGLVWQHVWVLNTHRSSPKSPSFTVPALVHSCPHQRVLRLSWHEPTSAYCACAHQYRVLILSLNYNIYCICITVRVCLGLV